MEEKMRHINHEPVSSGDPQAIEKLSEKLDKCRETQTYMKDVNAYYRKNGTCVGYPGMDEAAANVLDRKVQQGYSWEKQPFTSYTLTNNNSEIKRLEMRIEQITRYQEVGFSGWEFNGGKAEANTELNRLQLFFDEKPNEQQRQKLKDYGFRWAPSQGAWQRQLTDNAITSANHIEFIKPTDGRSVRAHQPKPPVKDTGAR
jgi:hypothetical protein